MTRLLWIRHGQTPSNVAGLIDTALPGPELTELGRQQALDIVESLAAEPIEAVHCSAARRAWQTAEPLATARGLSLGVHADLKEVQAGDWELSAAPHDVRGYVDVVAEWLQGRLDVRMPGPRGEDGREVLSRVDAVIEHVTTVGTVAVVAHGALIRFWCGMRCVNLDARFVGDHRLRNTGVVIVRREMGQNWVCEQWTDAMVSDAVGPAGPAAAELPVDA